MLGSLVSCCGLIKLRKKFQGYVWVSRYLRDVENLGLCCQSFKEHGLAYCLVFIVTIYNMTFPCLVCFLLLTCQFCDILFNLLHLNLKQTK